jgi:hypothetical protein
MAWTQGNTRPQPPNTSRELVGGDKKQGNGRLRDSRLEKNERSFNAQMDVAMDS